MGDAEVRVGRGDVGLEPAKRLVGGFARTGGEPTVSLAVERRHRTPEVREHVRREPPRPVADVDDDREVVFEVDARFERVAVAVFDTPVLFGSDTVPRGEFVVLVFDTPLDGGALG